MSFFPGGVFFPRYTSLNLGKANEELYKVKSFEMMHYDKCGPFTVEDMIKFEIRMYPVGDYVQMHICLLSGAELIKGYGFFCRGYGPHGPTSASHGSNSAAFVADSIGEALGLPMRCISTIGNTYDCIFLWFNLDDSRKTPVKPNKSEQVESTHDVEPNLTKICSSGVITTLLNGEFADVCFVVDGQTFPAHRAVLAARSSVFRSEFLALQDELCQNGVFVSIRQHIDALTFKNLLHFMYTDSLPPDFDEPTSSRQRYHRLFIAAYLLKIEGLKKLCEEKLTVSVTECILSTLDEIDFQDSGLLKIVQKDCDKKPEIITTTTKEPKVGDRLDGSSISK